MVLITTYYIDKNPNRQLELDFVLEQNIQNIFITDIFLLCEQPPQKELPRKVSILNVGKRLKFQELIVYANRINSNELKILSNSDIFFDETLGKLDGDFGAKSVYCLTRWDWVENKRPVFYENFKSQDAWIFRGIISEKIGNYYMGLPGCDNRFARELLDSGSNIKNPSLTVRAIHVHGSNLRNYNKLADRVIGEYAYPLPTELDNYKTRWGQSKEKEIRFRYLHRKWKNDLDGISFSLIDRIMARFILILNKSRPT